MNELSKLRWALQRSQNCLAKMNRVRDMCGGEKLSSLVRETTSDNMM